MSDDGIAQHRDEIPKVFTDEVNAHLFTDIERQAIAAHIPWTRRVSDRKTVHAGRTVDLLSHVRDHRELFVLKPNDEYGGTGVHLGWENSESEWDAALQKALAATDSAWVVQERIKIRREVFPMQTPSGIEMRDMLVDFAPYIFCGKMAGCLTRLSSTGLANVTSGGGQVPSFVVEPRA